MREPTVPWVTGRKKHIAHAMAVFFAESQGANWGRMPQGMRDALIERCNKKLTEWTVHDVLAEFQHPYREKETS